MPVTMPYQPLPRDVRHAIRDDGVSMGYLASRGTQASTPDGFARTS
jgi:hypothetical protein